MIRRRPTSFALALSLLAAPPALGADGWPMPGHDAAGTSRSAAASAPAPALLPGWPIADVDASRLLVAPAGAVHLSLPRGDRTAVVNRDGTWRRPSRVQGVVAIGPDGRHYAFRGAGRVVAAYTATGCLLWRSPELLLGPEASDRTIRPASDGTVYVAGASGLAALDAAGALRWTATSASSPVVGSDGTVHYRLPSGAGTPATVVARRPDGEILWQRPLDELGRPAALAGDGTLLVTGPEGLRALAPDGSERWSVATGPPAGVAVGADDTAYVVVSRGLVRGTRLASAGEMWAVAPDGSVRWTYRGFVAGTPVVGGDGTVYVGGSSLAAIMRDGSRAWSFAPGRPLLPTAIGSDGTLYVSAPPLGGSYATPAAVFALAGPSGPAGVRLPSPARQRKLVSGLRLSSSKVRLSGQVSFCAGATCRPAAPLGGTVRFTLKRESRVSLVVRRAGEPGAVVSLVRRVGAGTAWRSMSEVTRWRALAPGRYTVSATAVAGAGRVRTEAVPFTVVR